MLRFGRGGAITNVVVSLGAATGDSARALCIRISKSLAVHLIRKVAPVNGTHALDALTAWALERVSGVDRASMIDGPRTDMPIVIFQATVASSDLSFDGTGCGCWSLWIKSAVAERD